MRLIFKIGSRHPLERGSAGYAIASLRHPRTDDPPSVVATRRTGYAQSHGEVERALKGG